jgi:hypothetical protein
MSRNQESAIGSARIERPSHVDGGPMAGSNHNLT